jgi:glycosyltransferase involved in cell wall biosynthesis
MQRSGRLLADPNPIAPAEKAGDSLETATGATNIRWGAQGVDAVEVHVGSPAGPLFAHTGPGDHCQSASRIADGTVFCLQDVSQDRSLCYDNTLATVRIGVRSSWKVSALVTCFNHERYIRAALESVLAQKTSFPFEIVICDDGSSDGTRAILAEFKARRPERIRLLLPETNLGLGGVEIYMRGIEMCRGRYVALLDGDDCWTDPDKLQKQADFLDARPDCPMCFHNSEVRYEDGIRSSWPLYGAPLKERLNIEALFEVSSIHNSTVMFRPEVASDYREWCEVMDPRGLNDWTAAVVGARRGPLGYLDRVMAIYRQTPTGVWAGLHTSGQLEQVIHRYEEMDRFLGGQYHEAIERAVCARSYEAALEFERQGDLESAGPHLARCLTGRPEWLENYVGASGIGRDEFWARLSRRRGLYRRQALFRLSFVTRPLVARLRWLSIKAWVRLRIPLRLARGLSVGSIWASPNPAPGSPRSTDLAATTVHWRFQGHGAVEVRVGTPDGVLLGGAGTSGAIATGEWVRDGMMFFLQNVSGGLPLTAANTLDVVRVAIRKKSSGNAV